MGWSLGGLHAVELARRRPDAVRSIITLASPLGRRVPPGPQREAVEVRGSHLELGHNPAVAVVIADRLAQRAGVWRTFNPPRWARRRLPAA